MRPKYASCMFNRLLLIDLQVPHQPIGCLNLRGRTILAARCLIRHFLLFACSTRNQAKAALLFLDKEVLRIALPWLDEIV